MAGDQLCLGFDPAQHLGRGQSALVTPSRACRGTKPHLIDVSPPKGRLPRGGGAARPSGAVFPGRGPGVCGCVGAITRHLLRLAFRAIRPHHAISLQFSQCAGACALQCSPPKHNSAAFSSAGGWLAHHKPRTAHVPPPAPRQASTTAAPAPAAAARSAAASAARVGGLYLSRGFPYCKPAHLPGWAASRPSGHRGNTRGTGPHRRPKRPSVPLTRSRPPIRPPAPPRALPPQASPCSSAPAGAHSPRTLT